jgi:hypothetical protein
MDLPAGTTDVVDAAGLARDVPDACLAWVGDASHPAPADRADVVVEAALRLVDRAAW